VFRNQIAYWFRREDTLGIAANPTWERSHRNEEEPPL
jgi:hypothetical protein